MGTMMPSQPAVVAMLLIFGALGWGFGLFCVFRKTRRRTDSLIPLLLFRDGIVSDASPMGCEILTLGGVQGARTWFDFHKVLGPLFPDLPLQPPSKECMVKCPDTRTLALFIEPNRRGHRVTLSCSDGSSGRLLLLKLCQQKIDFLHKVTNDVPLPIWQTSPDDAEGATKWSNKQFQALLNRSDGHLPFQLPNDQSTIKSSRRHRLVSDGVRPDEWYEIQSTDHKDGTIFFAHDITSLMRAEEAQRNFVQTLAKTFAYLPTGIAIFDRKSQLVLFNPSLLDLTDLSAEFLSNRPTITTFFDQLRELRIMPEPKRYVDWRQNLETLISDAQKDRFRETWTLPGGLTYRITGRPHPDGAVAFLLEDVSAEVSLTRKFRSELELSQSVMDTDQDGLIVFDNSGRVIFSNAAHCAMWGQETDDHLETLTVLDVIKALRKKCEPSPFWSELRDFTTCFEARADWECTLFSEAFGDLDVTVRPLLAGATLVRFHIREADRRLDFRDGPKLETA